MLISASGGHPQRHLSTSNCADIFGSTQNTLVVPNIHLADDQQKAANGPFRLLRPESNAAAAIWVHWDQSCLYNTWVAAGRHWRCSQCLHPRLRTREPEGRNREGCEPKDCGWGWVRGVRSAGIVRPWKFRIWLPYSCILGVFTMA